MAGVPLVALKTGNSAIGARVALSHTSSLAGSEALYDALFDRLATVGLLPDEQLMGFRMMLGMFADVVGDDHLVSEVEITPAGQILLNGQRLR